MSRADRRFITTARLSFLVFWSMVGNPVLAEDDASRLKQGLENGSVELKYRLRHERVTDQASADADALTSRTRLILKSGEFFDAFSLGAQIDNTFAYGSVDYSTGEIERGTAIIADPEGTEINQLYLAVSALPSTEIVIGRQGLELDNERFLGSLEFRQNAQSFDAIAVRNDSLPEWDIFYGYIDNVNRVFGDDSDVNFEPGDPRFGSGQMRPGPQLGDHEQDTHLLNLHYRALSAGDITTYAYLIDNEDFQRFSTDTFGVRFSGTYKPGAVQFLYSAEYARQSDAGSNPMSYDASYYSLEVALSHWRKAIRIGHEVLGSDNNSGFVTPLSTLHQFQGWADKFAILTPNAGVQDTYLSLSLRTKGFRVRGVYHRFRTDAGNEDIGDEFDFELNKTFSKGKYRLNLTHARYRATIDRDIGPGGLNNDTNRTFLTFSANFF